MEITKYDYKSAGIVAHSVKANRDIVNFSGDTTITSELLGEGTGEVTNEAFFGALSLPNGGALAIPYSSLGFVEVSPVGVIKVTAPLTSSARFSGGCVVNDSLVVLAPRTSNHVGLYNPKNGEYRVGPQLNAAFQGCAYSSTGLIVFAPAGVNDIIVYNPYTQKIDNIPHDYVSSSSFADACPLPDGKVLLVPKSASDYVIVDPINLTLEVVATDSSSLKFNSGQVLPNGDVLCVPYNKENITIYRHASKTLYVKRDTDIVGTSKFLGSCLTIDGRVIFSPESHVNVGVYDIMTDTYSEGPALTGFRGACQIADGRIILPGKNNEIHALTVTDQGGSITAISANRYFNSSI